MKLDIFYLSHVALIDAGRFPTVDMAHIIQLFSNNYCRAGSQCSVVLC